MGRARLKWYQILLPIFEKCNSEPIHLPDESEISQNTYIVYRCHCGVECKKKASSIKISQHAKCYDCEMFRTDKTFIEPSRSNYCMALIYTLQGIEIWRQVRDYPNYDVSNFGNYRHFRKKVKLPIQRDSGYTAAPMSKSDSVKRRSYDNAPVGDIVYLHDIVCKTFIPKNDYNDDMTIDHKNRERTCNNLLNLVFKTRKEQRANQEYPTNNSTNRPIWKCDLNGNRIELFRGAKEAGIQHMDTHEHNYKSLDSLRSSITTACRRSNTIVLGYKWVYDQDNNKSLPGEIWVIVPSYILYNPINEYEVSTLGRIRKKKDKTIILGSEASGYRVYTFRQKKTEGSTTSKRVPAKTVKGHRILALTFLANPENKPVVDHINENKQDNRVDNLRWFTHKENKEAHEKLSKREWTIEQGKELLCSIQNTPVSNGGRIKWNEYVKPELLKTRTLSSIRSRYIQLLKIKKT